MLILGLKAPLNSQNYAPSLTELTVAHSLTAARISSSSIMSLSLWRSSAKASSDNSWNPFVLKTLSVFSSMKSKQRSLNSSCP